MCTAEYLEFLTLWSSSYLIPHPIYSRMANDDTMCMWLYVYIYIYIYVEYKVKTNILWHETLVSYMYTGILEYLQYNIDIDACGSVMSTLSNVSMCTSTQFHEYISDLPPPEFGSNPVTTSIPFSENPHKSKTTCMQRDFPCNAIFHELNFQNSAKLESKSRRIAKKTGGIHHFYRILKEGVSTGGVP